MTENLELEAKRLRMSAIREKRHRAETRFRRMGIAAVSVGLVFLAVLFGVVLASGFSAFQQTVVQLDVAVDHTGDNFQGMVKRSLRDAFPDVKSRRHKRELYGLVSSDAAYQLKDRVQEKPALAGKTVSLWVPASDDIDMVVKGRISRDLPPDQRRFTDRQLVWIDALQAAGQLKTQFNWEFFTSGDSREPELAGIAVATLGSLFSLLVCLAMSFPLGVLTAVYLEEFSPRTRWTDFIEVNINNLAAVPSIVFGLLGLAVFLNVFNLPRSAPLVGGMVLALMTLPTIIITGRAALKAVPPSIREAALAVGASPLQAVFHHVLPLAMPGVLTGTIIGTARALGETAPLLMIGMVAFIVDMPESILSPATALPVQVFLWADSPERAFEERTAAAILILLVFTIVMNLAAVLLRKKYEIRW
ncbi:MAG: phosphate ABC transporter permease PstA [Alphaproteobacteria bacterium]|jgi:phosphate transport system permease protein|nr:phosphate ABC transporter permease PstA [Alphaproteobacteria bacterium]MBT7944421.1 phosphate ABC transporter permease PstA [Alphaproteobacteria bacterium]